MGSSAALPMAMGSFNRNQTRFLVNMSAAINLIWKDDRLGRKEEAGAIIGYIESVANRPRLSANEHAHVLAIDGGYGEGKTFFLQNLAEQLKASHPVAYIDAWRDDLEDEPLTAIAATIEDALAKYMAASSNVRNRVKDWRDKAGNVLKITAGGALRRLVGLAVTQVAADELHSILTTDQADDDFVNEAAKKMGEDVADKALIAEKSGEDVMAARIATFRAGRAAIDQLKGALEGVVASLETTDTQAPIVIIIDELDRCRPTYAIKLLEEVKHLFDVKGVVFVFGMHGDQLAHSISKAYGAGFQSVDYLRRFIHRRYTLRPASLTQLTDQALRDLSLDTARLNWYLMGDQETTPGRATQQPPAEAIAIYLKSFGVAPRDAFRVFEMLQMCLALTGSARLHLPLLLPMIIGATLRKGDRLPRQVDNVHMFVYNQWASRWESKSLADVALTLYGYSQQSQDKLLQSSNRDNDYFAGEILDLNSNAGSDALGKPLNYEVLISTVSRFDANPTRV